MKTCTKCEKELDLAEFNADNRKKDGKRTTCRNCDSAQKKQIREDNIEEYRRRNAENNRKYRQKLSEVKVHEDAP